MPLAFPSHQGLILPLWRRWPHRFDAIGLCVGAAMPDVVEVLVFLVHLIFQRREVGLGQGIGHSLVGVVALSVPLGLGLTHLVRKVTPRRWLDRFASSSCMTPAPTTKHRLWPRAMLSVGVGALSHVLFDLITHANFVLLLPWYESDDFFPRWWRHTWVEISVFVYRKPYPIGPHFVVWVLMSVLGIWLFVRCWSRGRRRSPGLDVDA